MSAVLWWAYATVQPRSDRGRKERKARVHRYVVLAESEADAVAQVKAEHEELSSIVGAPTGAEYRAEPAGVTLVQDALYFIDAAPTSAAGGGRR